MLCVPTRCHSLAILLCLALASCGGDEGGPPPVLGGTPSAAPTPSPTSTAGDPPATSNLPPAPFGLTTSAEFELVGWQQISQGPDAPYLVALAEDRGDLSWSAESKTYKIALADLDGGRLVYTFPPSGNNTAAFSIVKEDGTIAKVYVTIFVWSPNLGEVYWQTADGVTPFKYAHAFFGIRATPASLPSSGKQIFRTDTDPESSIIFDFAARKVSGTVTSFNDGGGWDPAGPKEQATLEPADIQPDGSFVAVISVPGAPRKGELRGRLFGPSGAELAVYWNAPVRDGYDKTFGEWLAVMRYEVCQACTG